MYVSQSIVSAMSLGIENVMTTLALLDAIVSCHQFKVLSLVARSQTVGRVRNGLPADIYRVI